MHACKRVSHPTRDRPATNSLPTEQDKGYEVNHFAGRYAVGKNLSAVATKSGLHFNRPDIGDVRVLGGACSEVLGGANLAKVLQSGFEKEARVMEALRQSQPAEALSVHTSAGVPAELDAFLKALKPHLPVDGDDWCVNLQLEGASAVHAAIDMALQMSQPGADLSAPGARVRVACGASSYHGPASTSPGGAAPLGSPAKGLTHEARYPVPTPFLRRRGEGDDAFHARIFGEFEEYLDLYGHEIGVLMVEPQWGSSVGALPWPPALLRRYVAAARARGIAVVADEIMCGLGRHGAEPSPSPSPSPGGGGGGTGCFLSECWQLKPDVVTFGKAVGGGAGHVLSGAVLLHGAARLKQARHGTALQSHTYAASSARALSNATALLEQLPSWRPRVRAIGDALRPVLAELAARSGGAIIAHGQGAMWAASSRTPSHTSARAPTCTSSGSAPSARCCRTSSRSAASCSRRATTTAPPSSPPPSPRWPSARWRRSGRWDGRPTSCCPWRRLRPCRGRRPSPGAPWARASSPSRPRWLALRASRPCAQRLALAWAWS